MQPNQLPERPIEPTVQWKQFTLPETPEAPEAGDVNKVGIAQIKNQPQLVGPEKLIKKRVSKTPQNATVWQSITRFFDRRFTAITPDEYKRADEIKKLSSEAKKEIDMAAKAFQMAKNARRKLGPNASDDSINASKVCLGQARGCLKDAWEHLKALEARYDEACELADKHASFGWFPENIESLEKKICYYEGGVEIGHKLLEFEKTIKNCRDHHDRPEDQEKVRLSGEDLYTRIIKNISDNPGVRDIKTRLSSYQAADLLDSDFHDLLADTYPDLKDQFGRLMEETRQIMSMPAALIRGKVDTALSLTKQYADASKKIDGLQAALKDKPTLSLEKQLKDAKIESTRILDDLRTASGTFSLEEHEWLAKQSQRSHKIQDLEVLVDAIPVNLEHVELTHNLSNTLGSLIHNLSEYNVVKILANKPEVLTAKDQLDEACRKLEAAISRDLNELSPQLTKMKEAKKEKLPENFGSLRPTLQFNTLITNAFPSLQVLTRLYSGLIETQEDTLKNGFESAIREGFNPSPQRRPLRLCRPEEGGLRLQCRTQYQSLLLYHLNSRMQYQCLLLKLLLLVH